MLFSLPALLGLASSDYDFTGGSAPAIATNKHFGMAFEALLCHLHENTPPGMTLALPSHVKPRSSTPPAVLHETAAKAVAEAEAARKEAEDKAEVCCILRRD